MPVPQRLATTADGRPSRHQGGGRRAPTPSGCRTRPRSCCGPRHPGVVEVVAERALDGGGPARYSPSPAPGRSAIFATPRRPAGVAGIVAAAGDHRRRPPRPRHRPRPARAPTTSSLDAGGRPVLCGFGDAVGAAGGAAPAAAPRRRRPRRAARGPRRRPTRRRRLGADPASGGCGRRATGGTAYARRALLTVADQATADDRRRTARRPRVRRRCPRRPPRGQAPPAWSGRPTRHASRPVGAPVEPGRARSAAPARRRRRRGRGRGLPWPPIVGAGPRAAVFGLDGVLARVHGEPSTAPGRGVGGRRRTVEPAAPPRTATAADRAPATTLRRRGTCRADAAAGPVADPDGDGCPSPVSVGRGRVEVDGVRYGVGRARRPARRRRLGLRRSRHGWRSCAPATGEVFVFDGWAGARRRRVGWRRAPSSRRRRARGRRRRRLCDVLVVTGADGARTEVAGVRDRLARPARARRRRRRCCWPRARSSSVPPWRGFGRWLDEVGAVVAAVSLARLAALFAVLVLLVLWAATAAAEAARRAAGRGRDRPGRCRRRSGACSAASRASAWPALGAVVARRLGPDRLSTRPTGGPPASDSSAATIEHDRHGRRCRRRLTAAEDTAPAAPARRRARSAGGRRVDVAPGDSFWSIAEEVLADASGRPPTDAEIGRLLAGG